MSVLVNIKNVRLSPQSKPVNFSLHAKENWAFIGNNSSGKTALAKIIGGNVLVNGVREIIFDKNSPYDQKVTFVTQRHTFKNSCNLNDFYYQQRFNSVENEDAESVWNLLKSIHSDEKAIEKTLKKFELEERKNAPILQLSSGEHKRLQLAKVFLNPPQLLILDQPLTGLDVDFRAKFGKILNQATTDGVQMIIICASQELPDCINKIAVFKDFQIAKTLDIENFNTDDSIEKQHTNIKIPEADAAPLTCTQVIKMENILVKYAGKTIISGLHWVVKPNEKWLITGKNGIGKSTLLSLVTGDNPQAYSNEVYLFDKKRGKGESIWDIKKKLGYLSPELHAHFDKRLNVFQTVASGFFDTMGLYKSLNEDQRKQVEQWVEIFELDQQMYQPLHYLSHTTQRWVLLARALIKNPPLLILDEPCQGFSTAQKKIFIEVMEQLCTQSQKTIIYVSHYQDEIPQHIEKKFIFNENFNYQII